MIHFDIADIIIFILLLSMIVRGANMGFVRQLFAAVGFFGGIFFGAFLIPHLLTKSASATDRSLWTLVITLGGGIIFLSIGEFVGEYLKRTILKLKEANVVDSLFGSLLGLITLLIAIWLSAAILIKLPVQGIASEIQQSVIIGQLNKQLPPAPSIITKLGRVIDPNGFPQVFLGTEPSPTKPVQLPSASSSSAIANKDAVSVVKIEGRGCGGIVEGSGFVAGDNLVITNAHVVAGVVRPHIIDQNGSHLAHAIWFDPNLDLAVLQTNDLTEQSLIINTTTQKSGTPGIVIGYPGGGELSAVPAAILDEFTATGRNIYNEGITDRDVYELQADVIPGNSGGPLIGTDGSVIGLVFAQSTVYDHVGYALTMNLVNQEFHQAESRQQTVGTGSCAQ